MIHKLQTRRPPRPQVHFSERKQRIYDFLSSHPIGVLSSNAADGSPHGVVIYFTINPQFEVMFLTKSDTQKFRNIQHDPRIMLTVFEAKSQATAQIIGEATEITDSYIINSIAGTILGTGLKTSDSGLLPITKLQDGPYVAFKIQPTQIRMAVYGRPDPGGYEDLFESIESFELNG